MYYDEDIFVDRLCLYYMFDYVMFVDRFYRVVESCAASSAEEVQLCRPLTLEPCRSTVWSSLTPDPKSHLAIDPRKPLPQTLRTF
ncbi:hypothetical protein LSTR_LSTR013243 [Laodelphax striatellus]|uniref:Uncharacterized protein n=1 Tax=Laodelphax striatellus TaxID=195883 RepID=A0A482X4T9_LAOST|nr:hypothetical protein LSTR_LSTR013243 [Laodelphax striatellus]